MNTYLIPINEGDGPYIKKIVAKSENDVKEKLYYYFFNKYDFLEGDSLDDIVQQLFDFGIDVGDIYDIEELS
jgi:hypothetical protein